jgi:hypothetical protein
VGAIAVRAVASLAVGAVALYWLFFAGFLGALRCDEGCSSPEDAERWQYAGQFWIAAVGVGCCVVGLSLGFTRHRRLSWAMLGAGGLVAAAWWTFVQAASL